MGAQGPLLVISAGSGEWTQYQAEASDVGPHMIGAGASIYKELACATSLQTPRRTAYGAMHCSLNLFIVKHKYVINSPHNTVEWWRRSC